MRSVLYMSFCLVHAPPPPHPPPPFEFVYFAQHAKQRVKSTLFFTLHIDEVDRFVGSGRRERVDSPAPAVRFLTRGEKPRGDDGSLYLSSPRLLGLRRVEVQSFYIISLGDVFCFAVVSFGVHIFNRYMYVVVVVVVIVVVVVVVARLAFALRIFC